MAFHLVLIAIPLVLLGVFLALVSYEGRTGRRVLLAGPRYRLDQKTEHAAFVFEHVDWGAFFQDVTRTGAERLLHDLAHTTLIVVRAIERELTSVVRTLRARREPTPLLPGDEPSRIAAATAYVRKTVRRSRTLPIQTETDDRAS